MRIGIFYGSTTGNTEEAAENIMEAMGDCVSHMADICKIEPEVLLNYDVLIFGVPTWDVGQLQMDWETFLPRMEGLDLTNKKIALFGLGDSEVYSLNFLDALGLVWNEVKTMGNPKLIGICPLSSIRAMSVLVFEAYISAFFKGLFSSTSSFPVDRIPIFKGL